MVFFLSLIKTGFLINIKKQEQKSCIFCKKRFLIKRKNQKICGEKHCFLKLNRIRNKKYESSKKSKETKKKWIEKNRDKVREIKKRYNNSKKGKKTIKNWKKENNERYNEKKRDYSRSKKGKETKRKYISKRKQKDSIYRIRISMGTAHIRKKHLRDLIKKQKMICGFCKNDLPKEIKRIHIDHIFPIMRALKLGWTKEKINEISNLQAVCDKCNLKKGG